MKRHALSVLAYVAATFAVQATSHFGVNAGHYSAVAHLRAEPIFPLGILSMLIQGGILAYLYPRTGLYPRAGGAGRSLGRAVTFAWPAGGVLVSYIALAEAAKYTVPAVGPWIAVEAAAGFAQFTIYGALLGLVHRGAGTGTAVANADR